MRVPPTLFGESSRTALLISVRLMRQVILICAHGKHAIWRIRDTSMGYHRNLRNDFVVAGEQHYWVHAPMPRLRRSRCCDRSLHRPSARQTDRSRERIAVGASGLTADYSTTARAISHCRRTCRCAWHAAWRRDGVALRGRVDPPPSQLRRDLPSSTTAWQASRRDRSAMVEDVKASPTSRGDIKLRVERRGRDAALRRGSAAA